MTGEEGSPATTAARTADAAFAAAHARLRADRSIQFDLPVFKQPELPAWLSALGRALGGMFRGMEPLAPALRILLWVALAALVAWLVWRAWRQWGHLLGWRRAVDEAGEAQEWWPDAAPARALLREADALAAAGRFAEAVHLLLARSLEEIERRRPQLLGPSRTSRDIAADAGLPAPARRTFAEIARLVERSLFGGRALDADDWTRARGSYESFAFPSAWA